MGIAVAALEHVVPHVHTNKGSHKPLTYIQQTVNIQKDVLELCPRSFDVFLQGCS